MTDKDDVDLLTHIPHAQEKFAAAALLNAASQSALRELNEFSKWLTAGTGAAFALIVVNLESIAKHIDLSALRIALIILGVSLGIALFVRFIGSLAGAALAAPSKARQIGSEVSEAVDTVNLRVIVDEYCRAYLPPSRWLVEWSMKQSMGGDLTFAARLTARLVQIQGWLTLLQVAACIAAILTVAAGVTSM